MVEFNRSHLFLQHAVAPLALLAGAAWSEGGECAAYRTGTLGVYYSCRVCPADSGYSWAIDAWFEGMSGLAPYYRGTTDRFGLQGGFRRIRRDQTGVEDALSWTTAEGVRRWTFDLGDPADGMVLASYDEGPPVDGARTLRFTTGQGDRWEGTVAARGDRGELRIYTRSSDAEEWELRHEIVWSGERGRWLDRTGTEPRTAEW